MKTMRRIDQPLQFEQPLALENSLLEIQNHYQQIVQHIDYFDNEHVKRRQFVHNSNHQLGRADQRALFNFMRVMVYAEDLDGDVEHSFGTQSPSEQRELLDFIRALVNAGAFDGDVEHSSGTESSSDSDSE